MKTLFLLVRLPILAGCWLGLTLLCPAIVFGQQSYLEVPVRLELEKGDISEVVVKVKKDGKDAFTQSGASKMRFKLNYGMKYTLVFTKPGYITKTIEFNTTAPSARIERGFEPYRIGVKLFLQNDDNQVIYNQPVAQIRYDSNIDEFNFETDYSKSILSAISTGDEENKLQETPSAPPKDLKTNPGEDNQTFSASAQAGNGVGSDPDSKSEAAPPVRVKPPLAGKKKTPPTTPLQQEAPQPQVPIEGEQHPAPTAQADGESLKTPMLSDTGDESQSLLASAQGEEQKRSTHTDGDKEAMQRNRTEALNENSPPLVRTKASKLKPSVTASHSGGAELPGEEPGKSESEKITREDIVEPNRIITKIKVIRNGITTEYTRINHRWGGVFYFRNNQQSISENLFVQWTGVRP